MFKFPPIRNHVKITWQCKIQKHLSEIFLRKKCVLVLNSLKIISISTWKSCHTSNNTFVHEHWYILHKRQFIDVNELHSFQFCTSANLSACGTVEKCHQFLGSLCEWIYTNMSGKWSTSGTILTWVIYVPVRDQGEHGIILFYCSWKVVPQKDFGDSTCCSRSTESDKLIVSLKK